MKINRFGYLLKEGLLSIFTHGFMSFASICIIVACLLIMGTFTLLSLNIDNMIDAMESENQILAYVDESLSEEEARALEPVIERIPNVDLKDVTPEQRATLDKLTGLIEDDEDVTNVYTTLKPAE